MTPRDWTEELTAYLDGELPEAEVKALEARLAEEPELRALEGKLRRTVALLKTMEAPVASPALRRAVLSRIDAPTLAERLQAWLRPGRLLPVGALLAAAVAVVLLGRGAEPVRGAPADEEQLFLAQNLEVAEDLDVLGLDAPEDLDVVARLHELEETR
jgi:anti-sigma factor RsiW